MISPLRLLRLDASIVLLAIVGVCAAGGFFFAFYETEEAERPLAVVRRRAPDPQPPFPMTRTPPGTAVSNGSGSTSPMPAQPARDTSPNEPRKP